MARERIYATAADRHRAFRLRRGVNVKKPVVLVKPEVPNGKAN
jgi:hypothetical protein